MGGTLQAKPATPTLRSLSVGSHVGGILTDSPWEAASIYDVHTEHILQRETCAVLCCAVPLDKMLESIECCMYL